MSTRIFDQTSYDVPEPVARVADVMATFPAPWALCGGWAVDAWLGRETRDHGDVDISVLQDDLSALFEHLAGWQLIAHDPNVPGDTSEPWDGRPLDRPAHIHARPPDGSGELPERLEDPAKQGFGLDIQVDEREGDEWVFSREPRVAMPVRRCVRESPWRLPAMVPEALLFYKASGQRVRLRDELDFAALLPHLGAEERDWLRDAVSRLAHPWLRRLSARRSL